MHKRELLTQKETAKMLGVSNATLNGWQNLNKKRCPIKGIRFDCRRFFRFEVEMLMKLRREEKLRWTHDSK